MANSQTTAIDVSVVIPLYNDAATIGTVLEALRNQVRAPAFEVIVVDDGSTDRGADLVKPPHRVVHQPNAGPAAARNTGASQAQGAVVLFLDADCTPPPEWVAEMTQAVSRPGYHAAMGTLCAANDGVVPRLVQLEVEDRYRIMKKATDGVDFIAAPSCGIRQDVFESIGGFDVTLRQAEDVEFAYRLVSNGHRIAFVDTVPVAHAHQTGWAEFMRVKFVRAKGRMEVFRRYPDKMKSDSWTPLSLKMQFGAVALAAPVALCALFVSARLWWLVVFLLAAAVAAGWPLVRATAERQASLIGAPRGYLVGAGYVLMRAATILAAVIATKARQLRAGQS